MDRAKFSPGTKFKTRGKYPRVCTVMDTLHTYNGAGELVRVRYVATHEFLGQTVIDRDVCETTIALGLIEGGKCVQLTASET